MVLSNYCWVIINCICLALVWSICSNPGFDFSLIACKQVLVMSSGGFIVAARSRTREFLARSIASNNNNSRKNRSTTLGGPFNL